MNRLVEHTQTRQPIQFDMGWRMLRLTAGLLLVGLGLAGMIVPIIPGLPLLVAGAMLVAPNHRVVRAVREHLKAWRHRRNPVGLVLVTAGLLGAISAVPVHAGIDDVLRERIQEQARQDKRLAGAQAVVQVQNRDVILSGKVRLYLQKMLYEQIAWHTQGVGEVDNEIRVVPEVPATDDAIKAIIMHLFIDYEQFHASEIAVQVKEGHVRLSATFREPGDVLVLKHRVADIEGVVAIEVDARIIAQTSDTGVWTPWPSSAMISVAWSD